MQTTVTRGSLRELDHRSGDGVDVTLLWDAGSHVVLVVVLDEQTGVTFQLAVDGADALDAFKHPYAYRHRAQLDGDNAGGARLQQSKFAG